MSEPLVSIIIVVRNAAATIGSAITSAFQQSYPRKELLIIDGASSDNTLNIIQTFKSELAVLISEPDKGIYDAMNKGLAAASGEWVYFLGADDVLKSPQVLSKVFSEEITDSVEMIYGNVQLKSNNSIYGGSRTYHELIEKNINHQSIFYRKRLLENLGGFNLRYKILADYDLNLRIFRGGKNNTLYIKRVISLFNDKGGASNIVIDSSFFKDKLYQFLTIDGIPAGSPLLQQYYFYTGFSMIFSGNKKKGLEYCMRSISSGNRKVFYFLVFWKFLFSRFGIGQKIKIV